MPKDLYDTLAARYDRMVQENPERNAFFRDLFARRAVHRVLDCACGTGRDLIAFHQLGVGVEGSDLSEAMLAQARANVVQAGLAVLLRCADFRELASVYDARFDAVVCLSNSINELLDDREVVRALGAMRAVLRTRGVVVIDQGQSDASMRRPPLYDLVVNDRDLTRVLVMEYEGDLMTAHVVDVLHDAGVPRFDDTAVRLRVRLRADWLRLITEAGFSTVEFYGDWSGAAYDAETARRLIAVAAR